MDEKDWKDLEGKLIHMQIINAYPSLDSMQVYAKIIETNNYVKFECFLPKEKI